MILLILLLAFAWLLYETDWMRVRLIAGPVEQPDRKWQFAKFGNDALILCHNCRDCSRASTWRPCKKGGDKWFTWTIPARTVTAFDSTMNFKAGCNVKRANLLKDISKAQKSKTPVKAVYPVSHYPVTQGISYGPEQPYGDIEIKVDGETKFFMDGDSKVGRVKSLMSNYCRPGEGKIKLVKVK